ncbi:putative transferase, protein kinase RLK-Pelle-LRR-Xb-1 family [Lupinus albus]|uniref:Putative transferase, protein kinase RLK-Pelle-LRR-Xb-1 family n=1 Tax=Lupinus albus TaxID=3870 RepID=A0A6A4PLJ8_LUPAL|nr:putative transferase, protein kinase RLK-Pelle-LRR-Xb-1 family [Lupinus albus]
MPCKKFDAFIFWVQTEVNFLGRLSHPNLVKLLGLGREDSKLFLVYEFMNRGSLDNHIYGRGAGVEPLSWDTRLKIMIGAAKGLAFLHTLEKRIIYRDLKPSNILLDKSHITTRVMGTIGYAAPEYLISGNLYVKSDVYAFGIVLLEMLTGLRIRDIIMRLSQPHSSLQNWLKSSLLNRGKMRSNMDARLEGKYPPKLALEVAQISLKCIQTNVKVKPSMVEVVERLEKIEAANEKPADSMRRGTRSRVVQQHRRPDDG